MIDLEIKQFEARVVGAINESNLPLEVKRLALWEIYGMLDKTTTDIVAKQVESLKAKKAEEESEQTEEIEEEKGE